MKKIYNVGHRGRASFALLPCQERRLIQLTRVQDWAAANGGGAENLPRYTKYWHAYTRVPELLDRG